MARKFNVLFFLLLLASVSIAQKPEQVLNIWSAKTPIEKIYLHFDKGFYNAGDISAKNITDNEHKKAALETYRVAFEIFAHLQHIPNHIEPSVKYC